jgi:hypothetical protein
MANRHQFIIPHPSDDVWWRAEMLQSYLVPPVSDFPYILSGIFYHHVSLLHSVKTTELTQNKKKQRNTKSFNVLQ